MPAGITSSGLKSASTLLVTMPCYLHGAFLSPPSSGTATLIIYDNNAAAASGTELLKIVVQTGQDGVPVSLNDGINVNNGIYAVLTGTAADFIVHYRLGR